MLAGTQDTYLVNDTIERRTVEGNKFPLAADRLANAVTVDLDSISLVRRFECSSCPKNHWSTTVALKRKSGRLSSIQNTYVSVRRLSHSGPKREISNKKTDMLVHSIKLQSNPVGYKWRPQDLPIPPGLKAIFN